MQTATTAVDVGISTADLDGIVEAAIRAGGGLPATKGMHGFPHATCTSANHVVCHGIPSTAKRLASGDLVKIAFKVLLDGWHAGICRSIHCGPPSPRAKLLVDRTEQATATGIVIVRPGATVGDLGHAIEAVAERRIDGVGFSVVHELGGHGIGREFFEVPHVAHHGRPGEGFVLQEEMFLSVQPILVAGKAAIKTLSDGWSIVTRDRCLSAQAEDTIGVTADGVEVFTRRGDN